MFVGSLPALASIARGVAEATAVDTADARVALAL